MPKLCVFDMFVDLLRIEKTSGDIVRERMKCNINKVMIGSVSITAVTYHNMTVNELPERNSLVML